MAQRNAPRTPALQSLMGFYLAMIWRPSERRIDLPLLTQDQVPGGRLQLEGTGPWCESHFAKADVAAYAVQVNTHEIDVCGQRGCCREHLFQVVWPSDRAVLPGASAQIQRLPLW